MLSPQSVLAAARGPLWPALSIMTVLALAVRLYKLGDASLWLDEEFTFSVARASFGQITSNLRYLEASHVPIHVLTVHYSLAFFGQNELALRLPSAVAGALTVPAMYLLGNLLFGKAEGIVGSCLIALSGLHIYYSQEGRPYALLVLFIVTASCFLWRALKTGQRRYWLLWSVAALLATATHLFALFALMAHGLYVAARTIVYRRHQVKYGNYRFLIGSVLPLLWLLPVGLFLIYWQPWMRLGQSRIPDQPPALGWDYLQPVLLNFSAGTEKSLLVFGLLAALAVSFAVHENRLEELLFLLLAFTVPIILVPLLLQATSQFFMVRYVMFALPMYLLLVSWGLVRAARLATCTLVRFRWLVRFGSPTPLLFLLLTTLAFQLRPLPHYFSTGRYFDQARTDDWRQVARDVNAFEREGDVVGFLHGFLGKPFNFYYDGRLPQWHIRLAQNGRIEACQVGWTRQPRDPFARGECAEPREWAGLAVAEHYQRLFMVFAHRVPSPNTSCSAAHLIAVTG